VLKVTSKLLNNAFGRPAAPEGVVLVSTFSRPPGSEQKKIDERGELTFMGMAGMRSLYTNGRSVPTFFNHATFFDTYSLRVIYLSSQVIHVIE
jgi:hypothetical protein